MPGWRRIPRLTGGGQTLLIGSSGNAAITTYSSGGINYRVYTFKSSSSLVITKGRISADYLVVGGGGGGGRHNKINYVYNGNGGAGGRVRTGSTTLFAGTYTVTVGAGGLAGGNAGAGGQIGGSSPTSGTASALSGNDLSVNAAGGIAGDSGTGDTTIVDGSNTFYSRGAGTSTFSYTYNSGTYYLRNGGGGAGAGGSGYTGGMNATTSTSWETGIVGDRNGLGGLGIVRDITGASVMYGAGGGGGGVVSGTSVYGVGFSPIAEESFLASSRHGESPWYGAGYGGVNGQTLSSQFGGAQGSYDADARENTGSGGGGASALNPGTSGWLTGGAGSGGIVVIRVRV